MVKSKDQKICEIKGTGYLKLQPNDKKYEFKLVDISSDEIKVLIENEIETNQKVSIRIVLKIFVFEVTISAQGIVKRCDKAEFNYESIIEFVDLNDSDKEEIRWITMGG